MNPPPYAGNESRKFGDAPRTSVSVPRGLCFGAGAPTDVTALPSAALADEFVFACQVGERHDVRLWSIGRRTPRLKEMIRSVDLLDAWIEKSGSWCCQN